MPRYTDRRPIPPDLASVMLANQRSRRRRPDPIGRVSPRNLIYNRGTNRIRGRGQTVNHRMTARRFNDSHDQNDLVHIPAMSMRSYANSAHQQLHDPVSSQPGPSRRMDVINASSENDPQSSSQVNLSRHLHTVHPQVNQNHVPIQPQLVPPQLPQFPPHLTFCDHIRMIGARNFFMPPKYPRSPRCVIRYKKAGFYISMISTITCLFLFWNGVIHAFPLIGRRLFIADKFMQMFVTDEDFCPIFAMLVIFYTMVLGGYGVRYTHRPLVYDSSFYMYLHCARCLILFGFPILIWYIWSHAYFYPDEVYSKNLEAKMWKSLNVARIIKQNVKSKNSTHGSIKIWDDTQSVFKCCGLKSFEDWFPRKVNSGHLEQLEFSKYVPKSCCKKEQSEHLCEAFYVYKKGCLQSQLELLTQEVIWVINPGLFFALISHLTFYIILGKIFSNTIAKTRRVRPFQAEATPEANENDVQVNNARRVMI